VNHLFRIHRILARTVATTKLWRMMLVELALDVGHITGRNVSKQRDPIVSRLIIAPILHIHESHPGHTLMGGTEVQDRFLSLFFDQKRAIIE
jgi:hypothetical protein